jgi:hypothetical protein
VSTVLADNDLVPKGTYILVYNSTDDNFKVISQVGTAGGGASTTTVSYYLNSASRSGATNYAGAWNGLGGTTKATLTNIGSGDNISAVYTFPEGTDPYAQARFIIPDNWTGGAIDVKAFVALNGTTGNMRWGLQTACVADDESMTGFTPNAAQEVTVAAQSASQERVTATFSSITTTGCAAGETLFLLLFRNSDDAADTATVDAYLFGAVIKIPLTL